MKLADTLQEGVPEEGKKKKLQTASKERQENKRSHC